MQVAFLAYTLRYGLFDQFDAAIQASGAKAGAAMREQFDSFKRGWKKGASK